MARSAATGAPDRSPLRDGAIRFGKRTMHLLAVLVMVSLVTFAMLELLPGNIAGAYLGEDATEEDLAQIERELGLDRPVHERFLSWGGAVAQGDLGQSPVTGLDVTEAILSRLPVSVQLLLYAQVLALGIAIPLGLLAGYREGTALDRLISGSALGTLAMPHFVLAIVLILTFSIWLGWLPSTGYVPLTESPLANLRTLFLPALTLALVEAPIYLRLLRSDVATSLREDFITVARAKGLSDRQILIRHALRPSSFTLITLMGINIGNLIDGNAH